MQCNMLLEQRQRCQHGRPSDFDVPEDRRRSHLFMLSGLCLVMSIHEQAGYPSFLLNDEQMSSKEGVEHQPVVF